MDRKHRCARLAVVALALGVIVTVPGLAAKDGGPNDRTAGDRSASAKLDPFLDRLVRGHGFKVDKDGRPEPVGPEELAYYARFLAIDAAASPPTARVRMRLDHGARGAIESMGIKTYGALRGFASAVVPIPRLKDVAAVPGIEMMQILRIPRPELDVSRVEIRADQAQSPATFGARGSGVIVGMVDTGVDFGHQDFRRADGTTRIKYLWNQNDTCVGTAPPVPFDFGCLYTEADINAAIGGTGSITAADAAGHGTHVLGTAGGDGSATGNGQPAFTYVSPAPDADLIVVKTFPEPGATCNTCFEVSLGLDFIGAKAAELGMPYSTNLSIGSDFGGHDGSDIDEMTIDSLTGPGLRGRVVAKSGGNNRGFGIHASGVVSNGTTNIHTFTIPTYAPLPGIFNDVQAWSLWYAAGDTLTVSIEDPASGPCGGSVLSVTASTGDGLVANVTGSGTMLIDDTPSPAANGARFFDMEVDDQSGTAPCRGTWTVRVTGNTITAGGRYDMWIWFSSFGSAGAFSDWNEPDPTQLISVPGTAFNVTTVGAHVTKTQWVASTGQTVGYTNPPALGSLAPFSSPGPTRDGRLKPEVSAPGMGIASALSTQAGDVGLRTVLDGVHWVIEGTSMSAPHVTGV
ncbi:S8 family serine peptidase, partial [Actinokineospora sp.]|uniref:S8 family serine peptidase n=1 Tax=Actinokineospora sp. TaxID=1872133 RepID=UPI003D6B013D